MRKNILLLFLSFLAFQIGFAAPRSYKQARAIALQKAAALGVVNPNASLSKQSADGDEMTEGKAYYTFDNGNNRGFVIVSGDDRLPEVIGYATKGELTDDNMPIQLKSLLDAFEKRYGEMVGDDALMERATAERQALTRSYLSANVSVSPLLGDIVWGQDTPFNNLCPLSGEQHCVTGCVATAMAQVMAYHKYPAKLQADIPAYSRNGFPLGAITASSAPAYDYANMLGNYSISSYTNAQASAVATLMFHSGCALQMGYGVYASSASSYCIPYALAHYFGYDESTLAYITRADYSLADWCKIIDHELTNKRPVIYSGRNTTIGGHAFVCDGADGNGFYHINWGWSGSCNGYFDITILNEYESESATAADGFNSDNDIVIGIRPAGATTTAPIAKGKGLFANFNSVSSSKATRTNAAQNFSGTANITVFNISSKAFDGWVALAVEKGEGFELISSKYKVNITATTLSGTYYFQSTDISFSYCFPVGVTKIWVVYGNGDSVTGVCSGFEKRPYYYANATETSINYSLGHTLSATITSDATIYAGISNDLTLTMTNTGSNEYLDNVLIYTSSTTTKPSSETSKMMMTVAANGGSTTRQLPVSPTEAGDLYVWIDDAYGNALVTAQKFTVQPSTAPVLTLISVESNAMADRYELNGAYRLDDREKIRVKAPKTFDGAATFTYKVKNTGGTTNSEWLLQGYGYDNNGQTKQVFIDKRIEAGETVTLTHTFSTEEIGSRFIACELYVKDGDNYKTPTCSGTLEPLKLFIVGNEDSYYYSSENFSAVYVPETVSHATNLGTYSTYWATYSNQNADTELGVKTGQELTLYNVTINNGEMTMTPRSGEYAYKVAKGEAVLIKTNGDDVKVEEIGTSNGLTIQGGNDLVATPAEAESIQAASSNIFYRLTYGNIDSKTNLGFHKAVATVGGTKYTDGSWINATPNKGYLNITKSAATSSHSNAAVRGFIFDDDDTTTAIDDISVSDGDRGDDNADMPLYNLQGQQVKNAGKGIFVRKNKKIIIQ